MSKVAMAQQSVMSFVKRDGSLEEAVGMEFRVEPKAMWTSVAESISRPRFA